jgi:hypothetical protein
VEEAAVLVVSAGSGKAMAGEMETAGTGQEAEGLAGSEMGRVETAAKEGSEAA